MAFDFQITENGDLMFYKNNYMSKPFKLSFLPKKGIKLSFDIRNSMIRNSIPDSCIVLSFDINKLLYNKDISCVENNNNLIQSIEIRLRTPLGDIIDNTNAGSKLELTKHKIITDSKVLTQIESYVLSAISDLIDNPKVIAEAAKISDTEKYMQCVNIYIYKDGSLLYSTQLVR